MSKNFVISIQIFSDDNAIFAEDVQFNKKRWNGYQYEIGNLYTKK